MEDRDIEDTRLPDESRFEDEHEDDDGGDYFYDMQTDEELLEKE